MVYESDFYTVRRPYTTRITPTISSYTVTNVPSQLTKYLPGVGMVYVVNTYHRATPHTVYQRLGGTGHTHVVRLRPSVLFREYDRIEHKMRPNLYTSHYSNYLNSDSVTTFEDEKRAIRAQTNALMRKIHEPQPRTITVRIVPLHSSTYSDGPWHGFSQRPRRVADNILSMSYYNEPARRYIGPGHLACVRYAGGHAYPKRPYYVNSNLENVIRNDINLLSYYLKSRQAAATGEIPKSLPAPLSPARPSRVFTIHKMLPDPADEKRELAALKATARTVTSSSDEDAAQLRLKKAKLQEEAKQAEEKALAEERARKKEAAKREEEAKRAEAQRQAESEKQRLLEEEAEREAQRIEKARKEAEARQAVETAAKLEEEKRKKAEEDEKKRQQEEEERKLKEEEEKKRLEEEEKQKKIEEQKRKEEEERIRLEEEERKRQEEDEKRRAEEVARLEEIAKQLEEEREGELKRQAEELVDLAREEGEIARKLASPREIMSPPAEAEVGSESVDEQADLPAEDEAAPVTADEPAAVVENDIAVEAEPQTTEEPIVEEPVTPQTTPDNPADDSTTVEEVVESEEE